MITDRLSLGPPGQISLEASSKPSKEIPQGSFAEVMRASSAQNTPQADRKDQPTRVENASSGVQRGRTQNDDDDAVRNVAKERGSEGSSSKSRKLNTRQKAMLEFMDSMESEFSIPPERIVVAMANLSEKQMLQAPEQTASQVIDKLGLSDAESQQAYGMYMGLLQQLSAMPAQNAAVPEMMPQVPAWQIAQQSSEKSALLNQLSMKDRRAYLNQSLEKMSQNFFMTRPQGANLPTDVAMMPKPEIMPNDLRNWTEANQVQNQGLAWVGPENPEVIAAPMPDLQPNSAQAAAALGIDERQYQDLTAKLAAFGITSDQIEKSVKTDPQNQAALKMEQVLNKQQKQDSGSMTALNALGLPIAGMQAQGSGAQKGSDFFSSKGGKKSEDELSVSSLGQAKPGDYLAAQAQVGKADVNVLAAGNAGGLMAADTLAARSAPQDNNANIQQIMNQANYMIKKGGGEAIVRLSPEGLGQVEMKVVVNEGRVNVQLNAETHEAKKVLESSVHDLKHSLGAKNLALDTIKVDVGQSFSNSTESNQGHQQQKMDMHQQGREQARQFFEQFRQDTFGGRNTFMDIPGAKSYGQSKPDPLKPVGEASASSRRYQGTGKGSGLNLVA